MMSEVQDRLPIVLPLPEIGQRIQMFPGSKWPVCATA